VHACRWVGRSQPTPPSQVERDAAWLHEDLHPDTKLDAKFHETMARLYDTPEGAAALALNDLAQGRHKADAHSHADQTRRHGERRRVDRECVAEGCDTSTTDDRVLSPDAEGWACVVCRCRAKHPHANGGGCIGEDGHDGPHWNMIHGERRSWPQQSAQPEPSEAEVVAEAKKRATEWAARNLSLPTEYSISESSEWVTLRIYGRDEPRTWRLRTVRADMMAKREPNPREVMKRDGMVINEAQRQAFYDTATGSHLAEIASRLFGVERREVEAYSSLRERCQWAIDRLEKGGKP